MGLIYYVVAAAAEIGGCYAFWAWLRLGKSVYWIIPGTISLVIFSILLTRVDGIFAGRVYAAYGGVYIVASLLWLWLVEGQRPDKFDAIGSIIYIVGALDILFGQRRPSIGLTYLFYYFIAIKFYFSIEKLRQIRVLIPNNTIHQSILL